MCVKCLSRYTRICVKSQHNTDPANIGITPSPTHSSTTNKTHQFIITVNIFGKFSISFELIIDVLIVLSWFFFDCLKKLAVKSNLLGHKLLYLGCYIPNIFSTWFNHFTVVRICGLFTTMLAVLESDGSQYIFLSVMILLCCPDRTPACVTVVGKVGMFYSRFVPSPPKP